MKLLDRKGIIQLLPTSYYKGVDNLTLRKWCYENARYTIPTVELVEFLLTIIGGRWALEIGSGNGDLGWHLGIKETDSYCQQLPGVKAYYGLLRQVPTNPPPRVENIEALHAVAKYRPKVVVGSWITHKYVGGEVGSSLGPDERVILKNVETYIHIGNEGVHSQKPILSEPHTKIVNPPFLITRATNAELNSIWIWGLRP